MMWLRIAAAVALAGLAALALVDLSGRGAPLSGDERKVEVTIGGVAFRIPEKNLWLPEDRRGGAQQAVLIRYWPDFCEGVDRGPNTGTACVWFTLKEQNLTPKDIIALRVERVESVSFVESNIDGLFKIKPQYTSYIDYVDKNKTIILNCVAERHRSEYSKNPSCRFRKNFCNTTISGHFPEFRFALWKSVVSEVEEFLEAALVDKTACAVTKGED